MALQELLDEYDAYLDQEVVKQKFPQELYRGDNRDLAAIMTAGGFFPKKNGGDAPTIYSLLLHCAENGYGGPFISTTEDVDIAKEFGANLYKIDAEMLVVAEENWTKLTDYYDRFKAEMEVELNDTHARNRANGNMQKLWSALQYHEKQKEWLVVNCILKEHIQLQNT